MAPDTRWPFPRRQDDEPENAAAGKNRLTPAPEGSAGTQAGIAHRTQEGLDKANARGDDARPPLDNPEGKATRFDGNPNPQGDDPPQLLKPRDDTPAVLEKKSGPRN